MDKKRPRQPSTPLREVMQEHAAVAAARAGKDRRIVTVGPNGAARIRTIPATDARGKPLAAAERHPLPSLASASSAPVHERNACYVCAVFGHVRQYNAVVVGEVLLCDGCSKKAGDGSVGGDPLDIAIRIGGFESNRSKH